jgi:hypothetical protein
LRQVNIITSPVEIAPITWDDFANIFAPFSWQVWMSFGGMLGLGAFLLMVIPLTLGMSGNFNPAEPKVHNLALSFYMVTLSYWNASTEHHAANWPARCFLLGLAWLVYVHVAGFTASWAALFATRDNKIGLVDSFLDVQAGGRNLCVPPPAHLPPLRGGDRLVPITHCRHYTI